MYTNLLLEIENTLGKIAGVTGAREGQIQNREAVGNVEREVAQTSHITEKWFSLDSNFRKRALTKFLECCKYAYKKYPKNSQFLLDDMGTEMVQMYDEFGSTQMNIHISNSTEDTKLHAQLEALAQAAIQNGQAKIEDLIGISQSESVQEIARKLANSAAKIAEERKEAEQQAQQSAQQMQQAQLQADQAKQQSEDYHKEEDRKLKYAEIEQRREEAQLRANTTMATKSIDSDLNNNGISDALDARKIEADIDVKEKQLSLKQEELQQKVRANRANEEIKRKTKMK